MKTDTDKLCDIISFSGAIENIYKILEKLEKKGKKDTEEYINTRDLLESARSIEAKKYREISNVFADEVIDYRTSIINLNNAWYEEREIATTLTEEDFLDVLKMSNGSNKVKRLFTQLRDISLLRYEEPPYDEEDTDILEGNDIVVQLMGLRFKIPAAQASKLGIDIPIKREQIKKQKENNEELRRLVCDIKYYKNALINAVFLEYLEKYIDTCKNKTIKNKLISYKYKLLFTTPTLEQYFIKDKSGKYFYQEMILFLESKNPEELNSVYTYDLLSDINDAIADMSCANYSSKTSTIDEKVKNILNVLYTKSLISSVIEEENLEYLEMLSSASELSYESEDDLNNITEAFNTDENVRIPVLSRKKVD